MKMNAKMKMMSNIIAKETDDENVGGDGKSPSYPLARRLVRRFIPKSAILEMLGQKLSPSRGSLTAEAIFKKALASARKNDSWRIRLDSIFDGKYPSDIREFIFNGQFAVFVRERATQASVCYRTLPVRNFQFPSNTQLAAMGPSLMKIVSSEKEAKAIRSVELDRLKIREKDALFKSSLVILDIRNRPSVAEKTRWILEQDEMPRKVICPKLTSKVQEPRLIEEFRDDLRKTIAWKDDDSFVSYLAYLLQPMLADIKPGMNPAYLFRGPTNSGKGYLSRHLPAWLYASNLEAPVFQKKFPSGEYEFSVSLAAARDALYYVFDEVKDISEEQTKLFDYAVTSAELTMRIMREGLQQVPNHTTFALTGVYVNFSDETWGRLATVELAESRTSEIESFIARWKSRGPDLLSSIFWRLRSKRKQIMSHKLVANRRPGFGLMADATELVFGLRPRFAVGSVVNDVLEAICRLEGVEGLGDRKGPRKRLSRHQISNELLNLYGLRPKPTELLLKLRTSMGTGQRKEYVAESGKKFLIELRTEGHQENRTFVYVRQLKGPSTVSTDIRKSRSPKRGRSLP